MSVTAVLQPPRQSVLPFTSRFFQVLVALLLGILLGITAPEFAIGLKFFSDAFLKLISMIVGRSSSA
jgi:Na+/H+-dicarboxylate symporter